MFEGRTKLTKRYRSEAESLCIDVNFENPKQLFDHRDPAPFLERDLDENFSRYLVGNVRDIPLNQPVKLVFRTPADALTSIDETTISEAVHRYFAYEMESCQREMALLFKQGRVAMVLGLSFLVMCIALSFFLTAHRQDWIGATIKESLTVAGWVALWKPINLYLYEWWPILDRKRYFKKLASIPIGFTVSVGSTTTR